MEIKTIIFWVLLIGFVIPLFLHGFQKLVGNKDKAELFRRLGYPLWLMRLVGLAEVVGCVLLFFDQTRYYGIAIFPIIFIGALYSHLRVRDNKRETFGPIFVSAHLLVIFLLTFWIH